MEMLEQKYSDVDFVWVSSHYDIHLKGICKYRGKLHMFTTDYDSGVCTLHKLTFVEKAKWLWRKRLFEVCVGYHWTYYPRRKQKERFYIKKPRWLWNIIYNLYYSKPPWRKRWTSKK